MSTIDELKGFEERMKKASSIELLETFSHHCKNTKFMTSEEQTKIAILRREMLDRMDKGTPK